MTTESEHIDDAEAGSKLHAMRALGAVARVPWRISELRKEAGKLGPSLSPGLVLLVTGREEDNYKRLNT